MEAEGAFLRKERRWKLLGKTPLAALGGSDFQLRL